MSVAKTQEPKPTAADEPLQSQNTPTLEARCWTPKTGPAMHVHHIPLSSEAHVAIIAVSVIANKERNGKTTAVRFGAWHETWNKNEPHPFACAQLKHVSARFQGDVGSPSFQAFLESEEFEGTQGGPRGASHLGMGDSGVRMVPQFSVDCQGVSRSVGPTACCSACDGCSRASWVWTPTGRDRFSFQILATCFFLEPLCCRHHCHFVLCRWWCVVPLFLWAGGGLVFVRVSTCVARDV